MDDAARGPARPAAGSARGLATLCDGREVRVTNPDKVLFAERGETKLDLIEYYVRVGGPLLETMGGRPVLLQRFPRGAGGPSFFQKRVPENVPEWLETTTVQTVNGTPSQALVIGDLAHVAWAVNLGTLGFHVWPLRAAEPEVCDELRLDLDPQPGTDFDDVRRAAAALRELLDEAGIVSFPKTTGNRGLHVYVRLERLGDPWAQINAAPQSLEPLLAMHERDRAAGLRDAPWPPVYPKMPDEPPRVAPSRARRD